MCTGASESRRNFSMKHTTAKAIRIGFVISCAFLLLCVSQWVVFNCLHSSPAKYNPSIIPIGSEDYVDITSSMYASMPAFVNDRCALAAQHISGP